MSQAQRLVDLISTQYLLKKHQEDKIRTLYELCQNLSVGGKIVELGSYHGMSTCALCLSSTTEVYAIDDYSNKFGWAGEEYKTTDLQVFNLRTKALGARPILINKDANLARKSINLPISLIFWDLGVRNRLTMDFKLWQDLIIKGGMFAVHDLPTGILGSNMLRYIIEVEKIYGWQFMREFGANIRVFVKNG
jgi:hypothetical protein